MPNSLSWRPDQHTKSPCQEAGGNEAFFTIVMSIITVSEVDGRKKFSYLGEIKATQFKHFLALGFIPRQLQKIKRNYK
jgi:hypothetical protein